VESSEEAACGKDLKQEIRSEEQLMRNSEHLGKEALIMCLDGELSVAMGKSNMGFLSDLFGKVQANRGFAHLRKVHHFAVQLPQLKEDFPQQQKL
jgi:hypothetical protein